MFGHFTTCMKVLKGVILVERGVEATLSTFEFFWVKQRLYAVDKYSTLITARSNQNQNQFSDFMLFDISIQMFFERAF